MNDLFNQFASAFGKKEELSPADAFLAKKNKELEERQQAELDALEFPEETVSAMQPSKEFDDGINKPIWDEKHTVKEDMICPITKEHCDDECCTVGSECNISGDQSTFSDCELPTNYSSMPQGLKESQQRNGVRDHGLKGSFEWTDKSKTKVAFVQKPNGTFYVNNPDDLTPQIKSVIDRKFPNADYVGTGDKVLYTGGIDTVSKEEQADLFEKEPLIIDHLNLIEKEEPIQTVRLQGHDYELDENMRAIDYIPAIEGAIMEKSIDGIKEMYNETEQPTISLTILGEPTAQKRHRSANMGKFTRQYDPSANDKADFLSIVQNQAPETPFNTPLKLDIVFHFTRPKSHYKAGKNADVLKDNIPEWHVSRPDIDNCIKFVCDALNKIYWRDDSLICSVNMTKRYSQNPRTEITITVL